MLYKGCKFRVFKIYIYTGHFKSENRFNPVIICKDYKFKLLIFVSYHFLLYYVIPFSYIGNTLNRYNNV